VSFGGTTTVTRSDTQPQHALRDASLIITDNIQNNAHRESRDQHPHLASMGYYWSRDRMTVIAAYGHVDNLPTLR